MFAFKEQIGKGSTCTVHRAIRINKWMNTDKQ